MKKRGRWRATSAASPSGTPLAPGTRKPTVWRTSRSTVRTGGGSRDAVSIRDNLVAVERRIVAACALAGRRREEVTLVAVSKTFPAAAVDEALAAGEIGRAHV